MIACADSAQEIAPRLLWWSAYEPSVKADLACAAYRATAGWVWIDPIPLAEELFAGQPAAAVFLTSATHGRAANAYRKRFRVPVWASAAAAEEIDIAIDRHFGSGEPVAGLRALPIPGASRGETAFLSKEGYLFLGDAVINLDPDGLALLPKKYCWNEALSRASLKKLLDYDFSLVTFAHGTPLRTQAKERFRLLLQD